MIKYTNETADLKSEQLTGFFFDWPNPPSAQKHLEILQNSYKCFLALDGSKVVGFINAISDGIHSAYIPLLEVLPEYQKQLIGRRLVELMMKELSNFYMIDLVCDDKIVKFYEKLGLHRFTAMGLRNMDRQNGVKK